MEYISKSLTFTLLLTVLICTSAAAKAQTQVGARIEARVLNPTGFITPGGSDELLVELINPENSGVTIRNVSGGGWALGSPQFVFTTRPYLFSVQNPAGCTRFACTETLNFPLLPGESATLRLRQLTAPTEIPDGEVLQLTQIYLSLNGTDATGQQFQRLYTDKNVIRIVAASGTGDESAFDALTITSDQAGFPFIDLQLTLHYPATLRAGEHFNVTATVRNKDSASAEHVPFLSMGNFQGQHAASFRHVRCQSYCNMAGPSVLPPDAEALLNLGNFYYEHAELFPGTFAADAPQMFVLDSKGRLFVYKSTSRREVAITTPTNETQPNLQRINLPVRIPLEPRNLIGAGDNLLVYDPNTGHEWLKVSASYPYLHQQVLQEIQPGGAAAGFAVASSAQVENLILNYLYASGINSPSHWIYDPRDPATNAALRDFQLLMDISASEQSTTFLSAIVSDKPAWQPQWSERYSLLNVRTNNPGGFFVSPSGVIRSELAQATEAYYPASSGTWLVRSARPDPQRPTELASFYDNVLLIPEVEVDGAAYQVELQMSDPVSKRLLLVSLKPLIGTNNPVIFDNTSGRVRIPKAALLLPDADPLYYALELEHMPDSNPMLFNLVELVPLP
jgi:hypothetical protein